MKRIIDLFKKTFTEFGEDKAQRLGAALAYYTIFSIAPLLLISVAIAGLAFGQSNAQAKIVAEIHATMGPAAGDAITSMLKAAAKPKSGTVATILGAITLLLGAAGVFGQLKDALNTIWNVEPKKTAGMMGFVRERFLSLAMVFGVGFLLLVTLVFDAAIHALSGWLNARVPGGIAVVDAIQLVVSFGLVTLLFAMIFRFLPDLRVAWRDVWFGAAFTSLLFTIGKFALGLYLGRGAVGSAYGAAGSLVIILVWVYWSSQILFFGAEFTQVYARTHGSLVGDTSKADAKQGAARVEDRPKPSATPEQPQVVHAKAKGGGAVKLAAGGAAGLLLGTLFGGITACVMLFKSAKKLITLH